MKFRFIGETEEIFCNFEEACALEDDLTQKELWTYSAQRITRWDNTLNIRKFSQVGTCPLSGNSEHASACRVAPQVWRVATSPMVYLLTMSLAITLFGVMLSGWEGDRRPGGK